ncbi:MAG: hypothetical protein HRU25_10830, partial [Psychrobium sp.]|nr:hypothetical protein [Psychrobium sp.]
MNTTVTNTRKVWAALGFVSLVAISSVAMAGGDKVFTKEIALANINHFELDAHVGSVEFGVSTDGK